jgi:hypothetical protein
LVPIALATLLTGCNVTVTTLGPVAPDSLVGYKLEVINNDRGGPLEEGDPVFDVKTRVAYLFPDERRALNLTLLDSDGAFLVSDRVSYNRSGSTGTVEMTFRINLNVDFIVSCKLRFTDSLSGTHRCEFEEKERGTMQLNTIESGWGEGTFKLEKP